MDTHFDPEALSKPKPPSSSEYPDISTKTFCLCIGKKGFCSHLLFALFFYMEQGGVGQDPPPLKWTFHCVDEPNWPQLRAVRVLADFVLDDKDRHRINDILSTNGRFVVLFDNRQSLYVCTLFHQSLHCS